MNRLIIIGNGFDLAHGIKTSYRDFIAHYLCLAFREFSARRFYSDKLIEIQLRPGYSHFPRTLFDITPTDSLSLAIELLNGKTSLELKFYSSVFKNSLVKIEKMNWVDLEIEYFDVLLATKRAFKNNNELEAIQKVNEQLDYLKEKLSEYLFEQECLHTIIFDTKPLIDCFTESIKAHEIVTSHTVKDHKPGNLFFLNFNYTKTFESYLKGCNQEITTDFNYIHGSLGGVHGEPIFGFGDELDKRYIEFEDEKNNELFKHIKSFEYLKNKNYYRLIRFIESGDYQVQIYGHSCGLSDRTMLNNIFENENCKSIKIFYNDRGDGTNDYTEKTYEISRHFRDKGIMRKKIVPLNFSRPMPQPKSKNQP
jgi:hypothetical protein